MSNTIDDGGPAFPSGDDVPGMSLRDWFAGQALAGLIASASHPRVDPSVPLVSERTASEAFKHADSMLAARKELAATGIKPSETVESMDLSVRSRNALVRNGIVYISDLVKKTDFDLLRLRNFGLTSLREVKRKLGERGLTLCGAEVYPPGVTP